MDAHTFRDLFLIVLGLVATTQLWLATRHIRHIAANRAAVPRAFKGKVPIAAHKKAADYTMARTRFHRFENLAGVVLLLIWTLGGGLDWLDQWVRGFGFGTLATGTLFILVTLLIMSLLDLPGSMYETFVIEQRFGFNKSTPALFFTDLLRSALIMLALGTPVLVAALWLMGAMGEFWWLYVWALWVGFSFFMIWAYPTVIAPLFNRFKPLEKGRMRERIQKLLRRTGFRSRGIFVIDSSRRTAHGNAYFTGFGRAKRIVFFDSLLASLRAPEVEAVLAHELGHFKRHHVLKRMLTMMATSLAGLAVLGWLISKPWFYTGLGMDTPSVHAALMLFVLVGPVFTFFLQPLLARSSRTHEYEADAFAAEQTTPRALVNALVKLYRENASTLTPDPVHSAFYDSHPPAPLRIARLLGKKSP
jgi:STE24 endopeptidase